MILHTGGVAVGAISTRSRSTSSAIRKASAKETIPSCLASGPIKRTFSAVISPLTRVLLLLLMVNPPNEINEFLL